MGTAGNALLDGTTPEDVVQRLNSFYAREALTMHWALAVQNRLEGQALFILNDELSDVAEEARKHAAAIAERVGQLGGAIPQPAPTNSSAPQASKAKPPDGSDIGDILGYALGQMRDAIAQYGAFLPAGALWRPPHSRPCPLGSLPTTRRTPKNRAQPPLTPAPAPAPPPSTTPPHAAADA